MSPGPCIQVRDSAGKTHRTRAALLRRGLSAQAVNQVLADMRSKDATLLSVMQEILRALGYSQQQIQMMRINLH